MSSYKVLPEYSSPLAGVPSQTSGAGTDQSRPAVVASGTLDGGGEMVFVCSNVLLMLLIVVTCCR